MKFIKQFSKIWLIGGQMILALFFCVSIASSGLLINMHMDTAKGDNYQETKFRYYIVPLASRLDVNTVTEYPKSSEDEDEEEYEDDDEYEDDENETEIETVKRSAIIILRLDKELFWVLIPERKSYCEFTFADFKKMQENGKNPLAEGGPQNISSSFNYEQVEGGKKIIGYDTKKYNIWGDDFRGMSWAAEKKFRTIEKFAVNQAKAFSDYEILGVGTEDNIPGLVLAQKMQTEEGVRSSMKVKSIRVKRFSEKTFSLPEGYTEIDLEAWMNFRNSFSPGKIWSEFKEEIKEEAKEEVKSQGKKAAKKALRSLLGD
ncbi:MAG: hypothetical protein KAI33_01645 [Elusimicrobiales bacterium]|nr:hypothetical protein [Elusimicrobiales bacterium]MCK5582459.1 hypothetical protein [Elusimicrobiales bacterium]